MLVKKEVICFLIFISYNGFSGLKAQDSIKVINKNTVFFKDWYRTVKNPKKAYFVKNIVVYKDSTIMEEFRNIRRDEILIKKITKNDQPVGVWYLSNEGGTEIYKINTAKINYCYDKRTSDTTSRQDKDEVVKSLSNALFNLVLKRVGYPRIAMENSIYGIVYFYSELTPEGRFQNTCILRSAHPILDLEVQNTMNRIKNFENPLDELFEFNMPVRFRLR